VKCISVRPAALIPTEHEPGFNLPGSGGGPFPHQRFDARSVFVRPPMRYLSEYDMVDAPELVRGESVNL
jgi:hypothetical protein